MKEAHTATKVTPLPWHVYEGGNFIKIGAEGYDEYIKRESYLGGPLLVAEVEDCATDNYEEDHEKGMANAAFIVKACNAYDSLTNALKEAQGIIINMRTENRLHGHITDASAKYLHKVEPRIDAALALTETRETK